ncbi:NUDIX hydrolase [Bacillaceae bacterium W0354]
MKLRHMATALLINSENHILFLQKGEDHHFLPGYLVPIGGHMELEEMNDPKTACLREIEEEAGIKAEGLKDLNMRYILHRILDDEIRIQYLFVAQVKDATPVIESDEGELFWKSLDEVENSKITKPVKEAVKHYFDYGFRTDDIHVLSFYED